MSDGDDGSDEGCCPAEQKMVGWERVEAEAEEHTGGLEDCSGQQSWGDAVRGPRYVCGVWGLGGMER